MSVFCSYNVRPYVYKGTHKISNEFYIGYREANTTPATEDLGINYFTSSKTVKTLGFENFNWEIIVEFFNGIDAYEFEQNLILENKKNPLILNRRVFGKCFRRAGQKHSDETKLKISKAGVGRKLSENQLNKLKNMSEETRKKIGDASRGRKHSEEAKLKNSLKHKGKTKSAETRVKMSNKIVSEETRKKLSNRIVSEETRKKLSLSQKGKLKSEQHKQNMRVPKKKHKIIKQ